MRRLLCADPTCPVCNAMALEIKQLLASEKTPMSPTASRRSQDSSCLDILSISNLSFGQSQSSQHSRELLVPPVTPSSTQLKDHKSLTQSAPQSTDAISIQDYWADHQLRQEFQAPDVFWDARDPLSSSLEECRIPVNQQNKKSNTESISEKQGQQPLNTLSFPEPKAHKPKILPWPCIPFTCCSCVTRGVRCL